MSTFLSSRVIRGLQAKRANMPAPGPRNKYGNRKVIGFALDGSQVEFDSVREAKRWSQLILRQRAGEIRNLERQVAFHFGDPPMRYVASNRKVKYVLDFRYQEVESEEWAHEDSKGMATREFLLKQAMMLHFHGIEVLEV